MQGNIATTFSLGNIINKSGEKWNSISSVKVILCNVFKIAADVHSNRLTSVVYCTREHLDKTVFF